MRSAVSHQIGLIWEPIVKICTVDVDEKEEHHLEYEAVRVALADALLRSQSQRVPSQTVLSSLEEQWVSDAARMLVRAARCPQGPGLAKERGGVRLVRVVRTWLARMHGYQGDADLCDATVQEFLYVPVACGPHGDIQAISDRCVFITAGPPSSSGGVDSQ